MPRIFIFPLALFLVVNTSPAPNDFSYYLENIDNNSNSLNPQTKKLPQAIIIGAKKCGTRALLKFIGAHPNVSTAGAEVHFFDRFYHMGADWYREQMPLSRPAQITMEKTPKYLIDSKVPARVFATNPRMKLVIVLRDPVTRVISEFVQSQWRKTRKAMESAQYLENNTTAARPSSNAYSADAEHFRRMLYKPNGNSSSIEIRADWTLVRNGIYINSIKQWLEVFPLEQILFVNGERLIRQPHVELERLQRFLDLEPLIEKRHFVLNRRKGFACIREPLDSEQVRCLNEQKGRRHPAIEHSVLNDLREFYRPFSLELFRLLDQEPWWPV